MRQGQHFVALLRITEVQWNQALPIFTLASRQPIRRFSAQNRPRKGLTQDINPASTRGRYSMGEERINEARFPGKLPPKLNRRVRGDRRENLIEFSANSRALR